MEEYFKSKIDFKSSTFYNDCVNQHNSEIENFLKNGSSDKKFIISIFNSLEILAVKTNEAVSYFKNLELDITQDIEPGYKYIFNLINAEMVQIDKKVLKNYFNYLIKIINTFSIQPETEFKFESISKIVYVIKQKEIAKELDTNELVILINAFKIKLNFIYFKLDEDAEETELIKMKNYHNRANNQACSMWRFCLENFFDSFNEEEFTKNINVFQNFYE